MTLVELLDRFGSTDRSLVVVNRTEPDPVYEMLADTFGDDGVEVHETDGGRSTRGLSHEGGSILGRLLRGQAVIDDELHELLARNDVVVDDELDPDATVAPDRSRVEDGLENLVLLVERDTIVAVSPLEKLVNAILLVNSDLYVTGARGIETLDLPAVITGLDDAVFTLRGYPESNRQKLLLITISRFIERVAWEAGSGTLRSSFQRLSRLNDETGTRRVYETVPDVGVDTHVYGVPDRVPAELDVTVHAGRSTDYTDTWFVVFRPEGGLDATDASDDLRRGVEGGVALLAVESDSRTWRGLWTFDAERIRTINGHIRRNL